MYTLVQKEDKHFLYEGRCTICLDNDASEGEVITDTKNHQIPDDLSKMQSTEFTCPLRRNEFWQTKSKLSHHYVPVSTLEKRVVKLSKKIEKNIIRKTTFAVKGPDVTLRYSWGHKNSDVSSMPRETESNL